MNARPRLAPSVQPGAGQVISLPARGRSAQPGSGAATERLLTLRPTVDLVDAIAGINWFNSLSRAERAHWLEIAGSAVPADAWETFKRSRPGAAEVQS